MPITVNEKGRSAGKTTSRDCGEELPPPGEYSLASSE